jgi:replicative DNA helicase
MTTSANAPKTLLDCRLGEQAKPALERLQEGVERIKTGFFELDRILGGGIPIPTLGVLAAKPKCGKSTLLLQMLSHIVIHGGYAYLVDLENGTDRLMRRIMCAQSETDPRVLGGSFVPSDPWRVAEDLVTTGALAQRLFVERERKFDWHLIDSRIRGIRELAEDKPLVVVLDSLQKLPMKSLQDRRGGIDAWMRALEFLRERYRVVVLVTSELKRPPQGQTSYKPNEVSLKESGDIEYSADLVLTLDREEDKEDEYITEKPPKAATMRVLYNRDGETGRVADYRLVYPYHRIDEIARPHFEAIRRGHLASVTPLRTLEEGRDGP